VWLHVASVQAHLLKRAKRRDRFTLDLTNAAWTPVQLFVICNGLPSTWMIV